MLLVMLTIVIVTVGAIGISGYHTARFTAEELSRQVIVARPLNWVAVKGKSEAVLVYELIGLRGEVSRGNEQFAELCTQALMSYSKQEWSRAIGLFEKALALRPQDLPATMLMARCNMYQSRPPGEEWDRVHRIDTK